MPLLTPLSKDQRSRMVDALEEARSTTSTTTTAPAPAPKPLPSPQARAQVSYEPEQPIIVEGDEGTHFYIIVEGEVRITKADITKAG